MERKEFIKSITAIAATGSLVSFLASCKKSNTAPSSPVVDFTLDLSASSNSALLNSGGAVTTNQVVVINSNGSYVALSDICTHQGCSLNYNNSAKQMQCPCHGGIFSLNGSVVSGPPPSSLKQYNVSKSGNVLHISG